MKEIHNLGTTELIDMLAKYTEDYTRMLANNERNEAFDECELAIYLLQGEINSRISNSDNVTPSEFTVGNRYSTAS